MAYTGSQLIAPVFADLKQRLTAGGSAPTPTPTPTPGAKVAARPAQTVSAPKTAPNGTTTILDAAYSQMFVEATVPGDVNYQTYVAYPLNGDLAGGFIRFGALNGDFGGAFLRGKSGTEGQMISDNGLSNMQYPTKPAKGPWRARLEISNAAIQFYKSDSNGTTPESLPRTPMATYSLLDNSTATYSGGTSILPAARALLADAGNRGVRLSSGLTDIRYGEYVQYQAPIDIISASFSADGIAEVVADYYVATDDFFDIEVLAGDGTTVVVPRAHAVVVSYPQIGRVILRASVAAPSVRRGFPMQIRITQATSGDVATKRSIVWAAAPSFATNPNAAVYYYLNAPTSNKNTGEWRHAIYAGNDTQPVLDTTGTPVDAEFASGGRPAMHLPGPRVPGQRCRLQVTGSLTGIDWRDNGPGSSLTNISAVQSANGQSWIDFNWNWDLLKYLRREGGGAGSALIWIAPQFTGTPYKNVRIYEIDGSGNRVSPGYWDNAHIAENARYAPFMFGLRMMDMMNTVGQSYDPNPRITQAGDIGQRITHSIPDLLDLLTVTGCTGRFHVPLQATEAWIRTEGRRLAKWARQYNKPVMCALANEIWNPSQGAWQASIALGKQAVADGVYPRQGDTGDNGYALRYWSYRHKQVMAMITEEFVAEGVGNLLTCCIELQNGNPGNNDSVCKAEPGIAPYIQAIATAPYIGGFAGSGFAATDTAGVAARIKQDIPSVYGNAALHRDYAIANGWGFFEYEGAFENIENSTLWHNLLASQDGYELVKYMVSQHQSIVGGNQTFYTDCRPDAWGVTNHIAQTGTLPVERPSMFMRAWHEAMAEAAAA